MEIPNSMIEILQGLARKSMANEHIDEDEYFDPQDMFGGNFDDTYDGGVRDGEISLARDVLDSMGVEWETT